MSSDAPLLSVSNISKHYRLYDRPSDRFWEAVLRRVPGPIGQTQLGKDFAALEDVSFEVRRGETIGIIGRNGSGKSTLLQIICGVLTPSRGHIAVNGRVSALLELGAGFNPEFTGRENVLLAGSILGLTQAEINRLMPQIEAFAEIGSFIDQAVNTYSSGMYVRLAFAVSIHVSPEILVVDEALAVGDTAFQTKCLTRIRDLQTAGVTIILVTHSSNVIAEYCDRALYLRSGKLVSDGAAKDVLAMYHAQLVLDEKGRERSTSSTRMSVSPEAQDEAEIVSVELCGADGLERSLFEQGEILVVKVTFENRVPIPLLCAGIEIKSTSDIVLWTGTTDVLGSDFGAIEPGRHSLEWKFACDFSGNRYVVAAGMGDISTGTYTRLARLPYAGHFDVAPRPRSGSGWLEPKAEVVLVRDGAVR